MSQHENRICEFKIQKTNFGTNFHIFEQCKESFVLQVLLTDSSGWL